MGWFDELRNMRFDPDNRPRRRREAVLDGRRGWPFQFFRFGIQQFGLYGRTDMLRFFFPDLFKQNKTGRDGHEHGVDHQRCDQAAPMYVSKMHIPR